MAHGSTSLSRDRSDTGRVLVADRDDRTRVVRPVVGRWVEEVLMRGWCSAVSQKGRLVEYVSAALKPTDVSEGEVASTSPPSSYHAPRANSTLRRTAIRSNQRSLYIPLHTKNIRLPPFRFSLPHLHRRQRPQDPGIPGAEEVGSESDGCDSAE